MRARSTTFVALLLGAATFSGGCALSHQRPGEGTSDGAVLDDGGRADASALVDAGSRDADTTLPRDPGGPDGVRCGPNRCRTNEICCSPSCGVCAFEDECVDFGCPGP